MNSASLEGQRALVTGGAGGLGLAVSRLLLQQGARLLVADRDEAAVGHAQSQLGELAPAHFFAADLSRQEEVDGLFRQVDAELGGLDILVACAGVGSPPLMDFDDDSWRDVIESNLLSYVACTQAAVRRMRQSRAGTASVILIGSISVHIKAVGESVYNAAKGGVASFAETLRKELIPDGIRVSLIEPGAIATPMQPFPPGERDRRERLHQMLPPDQVAEAVLFAATRPAGAACVTLRIEPMDQKIF